MSHFHYVTYKYVVIKDKRLGVAYYTVALLIVFYILMQLVLNKAYLEFDHSPSGNLRIITNSPPLKDNEIHLAIDNEHCCNNSKEPGIKAKCQDCRGLDGLELNWPVESKAVTIATYIKERWEETGHDSNDPENYIVLREDSFFTKNPEHVLLKIEHSIAALSSFKDQFAASHRMMNGWIASSNGIITKQLNSNGARRPDKIRLIELLKAAGVESLNQNSDALNARARTYRENGLVLRVIIEYSNSEKKLFGTNIPEYKYIVQKIPLSDYKVKQEIPVIESRRFEELNNNSKTRRRVVRKRFCVRVEFSQAGKIGQFSGANLIFQLISGLGLLTITATIIDSLALYILPDRALYSKYVYEDSSDLDEHIKNK